MNQSKLLRFLEQRRERGESLVLGTVVDTQGSTYSKIGDLMLIDANGVGCGMLSGGCLESDLAARAQVVLESGAEQTVTYNLASADDDVWGLGIGCDGSMTIGLRALTPDNNYSPFEIQPALQLLILGAGLDAVPVATFAHELGWGCTIVDHRPAYVGNDGFPDSCNMLCAPAELLASTVELNGYDAAIVMSHHLASDRAYLSQLAASDIGYIGLLGPAARKDRLLSEIGDATERLANRLHGPAGLSLGGRGPEPIALSIIAQIQQVLGKN